LFFNVEVVFDAAADFVGDFALAAKAGEVLADVLKELGEDPELETDGLAGVLLRGIEAEVHVAEALGVVLAPEIEGGFFVIGGGFANEGADFLDEALKEGHAGAGFALVLALGFGHIQAADEPGESQALEDEGDEDDAKGEEED
jgi:hypothetical protein